MACSKYQYVKKFEEVHQALLQTYIVVRVDGRAFTKFCAAHDFKKPNDIRAIKLMNAAAEFVCSSFTQIFLAYGQSDEYSFVFNKNTQLFSRRIQKILSCVVSAFTSAYVFNWGKYFDIPLQQIPTFDSRIVAYPNETCIKDYFRWRQVDCHINNLYNTVFWEMVKTGKSHQEVENILKVTNSGQKNQILFSDFEINYNAIGEIYRRGTLLYLVDEEVEPEKKETGEEKRQLEDKSDDKQTEKNEKTEGQDQVEPTEVQKVQQKSKKGKKQQKGPKLRRKLVKSHEDCIKEQFWQRFFK